mgnify:CR=1 FL=1
MRFDNIKKLLPLKFVVQKDKKKSLIYNLFNLGILNELSIIYKSFEES